MPKVSFSKHKQGRMVFRKAQPTQDAAFPEDEWTEYDPSSGRIFAQQDSALPEGYNGDSSLRANLVDLE